MIDAFLQVLLDEPAFHVLLSNSAFIAVGTALGQALVAPPAAWVLARASFPGRRPTIALYGLLLVLPFQALLLPNYLALRALGIDNTLWAVVAPGIFSAFPLLVMVAAFRAVPQNLLDSARLDGASEGTVFLSIGLPLASPGVFAALLLGFFESWNAVEQPAAFLKDPALWPIALFVPASNPEATVLMGAAALLAAVPGLLLFIAGLRFLDEGALATDPRRHL
ncbi:carbohydrate ABC transporter permease [uncultured Adlercreutzia sp.]|uniref:carbohydrate ABC transporter permease n=1 Tax=uncultured Adlercreutzia sp. TaxID=875803 RepID=UPI0026F39725|nr:carbohydrate ABC transporter permease [uncultured Adlercreutzia sp.]